MTDRHDATDLELQSRLRSVLADRAARIDGPPPGLPAAGDDDRRPLTAVLADRRPPRWRTAAAIAAAILVVLGLVGVLRDQEPAGQQVHTTEPPDAASGLPPDFDPKTAGRVMRINTDRDPETAARRYLRWRLTETGATPDEIVGGLQFKAGERDGAIVPVRWRHSDGGPGGTVIVRIGEHGSDIVASTTAGVDLSDVRMKGDRAVGQVRTTDTTLPGPARVDVLFAGHALPPAPSGEPGTPDVRGYGSAATGDEPFSVGVGENDPIVSVRFVEDGEVRTISELALDAPDASAPDFDHLTHEELRAYFEQLPPDPRCVAAAAATDREAAGRQQGGLAQRSESDAQLFDLPAASSPQAAVEALAASMGLRAKDVTITSPLSSGGVAGARFGAAPVEIMLWEDSGGFRASEVATPPACWGAGGGGRTSPTEAATDRHLWFSRIAGARTGQLWYRTDAGATWSVPLDADDLAQGDVVFGDEAHSVLAFAVVARDAKGNVILVQESSL